MVIFQPILLKFGQWVKIRLKIAHINFKYHILKILGVIEISRRGYRFFWTTVLVLQIDQSRSLIGILPEFEHQVFQIILVRC